MLRSWMDRLFGRRWPAQPAGEEHVRPLAEEWRRIQELLHEALERAPEERAAFLRHRCAGDEELHDEVASLLEAHERPGWLDESAADLLAPLAAEIVDRAHGLAPGATVGRYRILGRLGRGGMGVVYKARDLQLGRAVALKFLPPRLGTDEKAKKRFLNEARAAAAIDHPNICAVHEIGETDDGQLFIAMAFYQGETVKAKIARGPLPLEEALHLALQAAQGLAAAHRRGIVHRDVKPSNLIVTDEGDLKILDFGVAKLSGVELTLRGSTPGTVAYMSPEQAAGQPLDHRTDLWSLGATLYEMLSGERPFAGDHEQVVLNAIQDQEPPPIDARCPGCPDTLASVVHVLLEKDPADRYQDAGDLAIDLRAVREGRKVRSRPPSRRRRVRRVAIGAGGALAIVLSVGVGLRTLPTEPAGAEVSQLPAIAVLPFAHFGSDPDGEHLSDGMTEDILAQLAGIDGLRVISRTSTERYRGAQLPLPQIAAELGVGYVLEGSVRRSEDQLRVVAQLIDAHTDEHLWADTYDGHLGDIFTLQGEIAVQIARALEVPLSRAERRRLARAPTESPLAYELVLRARALVGRGMTENETAVDLLKEALRLDPDFAEAHAQLARVYSHRVDMFGFPRVWVDSAEVLARRAIELDPEAPDGYLALVPVLTYRSQWREVLDMLRELLEHNPGHAGALTMLGGIERRVGRLDESIFAFRRALELDPVGSWPTMNMGSMYWMLGDWAEAQHWYDRADELDHPSVIPATLRVLETAYQGRFEEAREQARVLLAARPEPWAVYTAGFTDLLAQDWDQAAAYFHDLFEREPAWRPFEMFPSVAVRYGLVLMHLGEGERALEILEGARVQAQRDLAGGNEGFALRLDMAMVHAIRGESAAAFGWLDRAYEAGSRDHRGLALDPSFVSIHGEPGFEDVLSRIRVDVGRMLARVRDPVL